MIKVVKILKELQARLDSIEEQLKRLKQTQGVEKEENNSKLSYEEVVDQWLNGKASS